MASEEDEGGKKEEKGDLHLKRHLTKSPKKNLINKWDFRSSFSKVHKENKSHPKNRVKVLVFNSMTN